MPYYFITNRKCKNARSVKVPLFLFVNCFTLTIQQITLQFGVKIVAGRDGAMLPISLSWLGPDQLVQLAAALSRTEHAQSY